jgi:hypothetical protein
MGCTGMIQDSTVLFGMTQLGSGLIRLYSGFSVLSAGCESLSSGSPSLRQGCAHVIPGGTFFDLGHWVLNSLPFLFVGVRKNAVCERLCCVPLCVGVPAMPQTSSSLVVGNSAVGVRP